MRIITKFNVGDIVWIVAPQLAHVRRVEIDEIEISCTSPKSKHAYTNYYVKDSYYNKGGRDKYERRFAEDKCFKTKEELLKSL